MQYNKIKSFLEKVCNKIWPLTLGFERFIYGTCNGRGTRSTLYKILTSGGIINDANRQFLERDCGEEISVLKWKKLVCEYRSSQ